MNRSIVHRSRTATTQSINEPGPFESVFTSDHELDHVTDDPSTSGDESCDECEEEEEDKRILEEYKVADIHFAFHNAKLVKLLFARGEAIKEIDREKRAEIEEQINKDIFTDIAEVQRLNKISSAFITFNETDSHDKALSMKRHECTLMRQHVKFTEPPEPTNVQWENKQLSKNDVKNNII